MSFNEGDDVIVREYPTDTGKPSPVGHTGRVMQVSVEVPERGHMVHVALDIPNPDLEVRDSEYMWIFFSDELDIAESDD